VKYRFVDEHRSEWAVWKICRVLRIARSAYHAWVKAGRPVKEAKDVVVLAGIRQVERENHGNYGVRRVHQALRMEKGLKVSRKQVQKLMHDNGIKARRNCKFKPQTTKADPREATFPNLLEQNFTVERANTVWLSDITYIRTGGAWSYLAVVMDLYDRKPVGWALDGSPTAELACQALRRALLRRKPGKGLIHHSDRGSQYTSTAYRQLLNKNKMRGSMSQKGNPYDNAPMESFFKTLKVEWIHWHHYLNIKEALVSLTYYLDVYYCFKRLHSALGYTTPKNYEKRIKPAV
jgi:putative transposase